MKADREFAWEGDELRFEVVANATWIMPRSGYSEEQGLFVVDGTPSYSMGLVKRLRKKGWVQYNEIASLNALLLSKAFALQS